MNASSAKSVRKLASKRWLRFHSGRPEPADCARSRRFANRVTTPTQTTIAAARRKVTIRGFIQYCLQKANTKQYLHNSNGTSFFARNCATLHGQQPETHRPSVKHMKPTPRMQRLYRYLSEHR